MHTLIIICVLDVLSFIENLQFYILISVNVYDRISVVLQEGVDTMSYKEDVRMIKALADENRLRIFWNVCIMEKNVPALYLKSYPLPNQLFLII